MNPALFMQKFFFLMKRSVSARIFTESLIEKICLWTTAHRSIKQIDILSLFHCANDAYH